MSRTSLILIDLQRDFIDCVAQSGRLRKGICIPSARKLIEHARDNDWQVIHSITVHSPTGTLPEYVQHRFNVPYCLENSPGAEMVSGLLEESDIVVRKQNYSGYLNTNLDDLILSSEAVVIAGIAADCCVFHTAADISMRANKKVYLPYQAISASESGDYVFGLRAAAKSFAKVVDLDRLVAKSHPDEQMLIIPAKLRKLLENWYGQRANVANEIDSRRIQSDPLLELDDALQSLEDRLASF